VGRGAEQFLNITGTVHVRRPTTGDVAEVRSSAPTQDEAQPGAVCQHWQQHLPADPPGIGAVGPWAKPRGI